MSDEQSPESRSRVTATRRDFMSKVSLALGGLSAALLGGPVVGYLIAPLFKRPAELWRSVGRADDFEIGRTVEVTFTEASPLPWSGVTAQSAAWLRRQSETDFAVFSVKCTHLGCPVSWLPDAALFMCPCHGGVYYDDGTVAAGPPPHALPRYQVRLRNGEVEILVSENPTSDYAAES